MPPVMITAVMPIAMIATKAKLRVTLKRLRSVAKVSVRRASATQARIAASTEYLPAEDIGEEAAVLLLGEGRVGAVGRPIGGRRRCAVRHGG